MSFIRPSDFSLIDIDNQDTFEDAPEITPKARAKSPEATRSLTDRRSSSAASSRTRDMAHAIESTLQKNEDGKDNHLLAGVQKPLPQKIQHVDGLDDINLGDGE